MRSPEQYLSLLRHMGSGWLLYRLGYSIRRRVGLLRWTSRAVAWRQVPAEALALHKPTKLTIPSVWGNSCISEAERVLRGEYRLFSHILVKSGFPPDWNSNQLTEAGGQKKGAGGQRSDIRRRSSEAHWSEISDFGGGDIKGVWELSRFPWAFVLARAHARTGDARYADAFWRLFTDWCGHNPPNIGPNWMCGQEATFRLMAVVFAAETLGVPEANKQGLARFLAVTGRRIAANLDYALSQKNNHGISECIGLITVALLLPNCAEGKAWLARGLRELQDQLDELVYVDGGFSQHSLIYHRVLLHDLCWCRFRLELTGHVAPVWLEHAGKRALDFLIAITDPATGQAPLYGSNDGANVLPLSDSEFLDLRPVIQMTSAVFRGELPLPAGPWDEAAAWLKKDWDSLPRTIWPALPARWHAPVSGCFQMVHGGDRLFLRGPTRFRHRPAQADMLHVDVWHEGRPIAFDGGSFSYNTTERFTLLGAACQHNVLTVDGMEPLQKFSRFLYLPWPTGESNETEGGVFKASHTGYAALGVKWTREVSCSAHGTGFIVRDKVTGATGRALLWHWRLADLPWEIKAPGDRAETMNYRIGWTGIPKARSSLLRTDQGTARGWWSPYYSSVEPATALSIEVEAEGDVELVTEFGSVS